MFDILSVLPGKKKSTGSGWWSMNAICCSHRGHRADTRKRGGIKFDGTRTWHYHCFNCGFSCGFTLGETISFKTKQLLEWGGNDREQIQKWSLASLSQRDILDFISPKNSPSKVDFPEISLPPDAEFLDRYNPSHRKFIQYIESRGLPASDYPYMITPNAARREANRIIIPFTHKKTKVVGYSCRYIDDAGPKYIDERPTGYVFGIDWQDPEWQVCIVTEGVFDAISIDGCALLHDTISAAQAKILASLNRKIIMVPDFDASGLEIIERALDLGFSVSLPPWGKNIKDVNDAVKKYGKLATMLAIVQYATTSKIKLEMRKRQILQELKRATPVT